MRGEVIFALAAGSALCLPVQYASEVLVGAFRIQPMGRLVPSRPRSIALAVALAFTAYLLITVDLLTDRLPWGVQALVWTVGGLGLLTAWFVCRQAHAQFDNTITPAIQFSLVRRWTVNKYVRPGPCPHAEVQAIQDGHEVCIVWKHLDRKAQCERFAFDSEDEAIRWRSSLDLYM